MLVWPGMIILLLPVIIIEIIVSRRNLKKPTKDTIIFTSVSNVVSTVVGIPLTWFLLVVIQMATGGGGAEYALGFYQLKVICTVWSPRRIHCCNSRYYM